MWQRTREGDAAPRPLVGKAVQQLAWVLVAASVLLIAVGTVVTGAGPHAGDSSDVHAHPGRLGDDRAAARRSSRGSWWR